MKLLKTQWLLLALIAVLSLATAHATTPSEPTFPPNSCGSYSASITSAAPVSLEAGRDLPSGFNPATNSDTSNIQAALTSCASGSGQRALELVKGTGDAIYLKPITVPAGVSLMVAAGVTVFASNDARDYDVTSGTCGTYSSANDGCKALITFQGSGSGLYGYGIIDGRGWANAVHQNLTWTDGGGVTHTCGASTDSWWNRTVNVGKSPCKGASQNNPKLVFALGTNIVIYKITLRNAPFWNILWRSLLTAGGTDPGITVWGLKVQSPWAVPNTDGIDIDGPNAFVTDSVFAVGDDEIAIEAPDWSDGGWRGDVTGVAVQNSTGYGRNGMSIGSELYHNVSSTSISNVNLTSAYASVRQSGSTWYVNNTALTTAGTGHSDITTLSQVVPATVTNIRGLNIKTNHYSTTPQASVTASFSDVCMANIVQPITVQPYTTGLTSVSSVNATYNGIFIMAPDTNQMQGYNPGTSYSPPAAALTFDANSSGNSTISLSNFTSADYSTGYSAIGYIYNNYSNISTAGSVFPSVFNRLNLAHSTDPHGESASTINEEVHTYLPQVTTGTISGVPLGSAPTGPTGFSCFAPGGSQTFSFLSIDANVRQGTAFYTNTSLNSTVTVNAGTVSIGAVIQPAMSQVAYYSPSDYGETLYAFASPLPDNTVTFQLKDSTGSTLLASSAVAISTIAGEAYASFTLTSGDYTMIVYYPGDTTAQNVYPASWRRFKIHVN